MILLLFFLYLIAVPVYLVIGAFVAGTSLFINALPILIASYLLLAVLGLIFLPIKSFFEKYAVQIDRTGQIVGLILFGPLVALIIFAIIALPFVMIYSLTDNPFAWFAVIVAVIGLNIYYHRYRTNA